MKPDETHESFPRFIYLKSKERIYQKPEDFNDFWPRDAFIIGNLVRSPMFEMAQKKVVSTTCKQNVRPFVKGWVANRRQFWHSEPHCFVLSRSKFICFERLTSSSCMEFSYSFAEKKKTTWGWKRLLKLFPRKKKVEVPNSKTNLYQSIISSTSQVAPKRHLALNLGLHLLSPPYAQAMWLLWKADCLGKAGKKSTSSDLGEPRKVV